MDWLNILLRTIIIFISFLISWNFIGRPAIRGRIGTIIHWIIRVFATFIMSEAIVSIIIFLTSISLDNWFVIIFIIVLIDLLILVLKLTVFSKKEIEERVIDKQKNRYIILMKRIINGYYSKKNNTLNQEEIIDKESLNDKYIYSEIEELLKKEELITKDKKIDFKTIIFLEKYVKDSMGYTINALVFIITLVTIMISTFESFYDEHSAIISIWGLVLILVLIFSALPKDRRK